MFDNIFFILIVSLGSLYWLGIYFTDAGKQKINNKSKYTQIDRLLQVVFFPVTLIVCALNFILYTNIDFIK